jgi:hypothetical protein
MQTFLFGPSTCFLTRPRNHDQLSLVSPSTSANKWQQLIFRSHANSNHQRAFVLPSQESAINTNYGSTVCEAGHTLQEAPEDALQHQIVLTYFIGQPLTTRIDVTSSACIEVCYGMQQSRYFCVGFSPVSPQKC